ncbi:MAG: site-specific integrase [Clostridia bacterium]|nr:site-specific integrase [Clostridia bacterium]
MSRIRQRINLNGIPSWITGNNIQDLIDNAISRALKNSEQTVPQTENSIPFGKYLSEYLETYKSHQASNTIQARNRIITKHVLPRIGDLPLNTISTSLCQKWFDELCDQGYSKETLLKIKNSISPAFDSAVSDGLLRQNPFKDSRFKINTDKGTHHKAIPNDKFKEVKSRLCELPERERYMMALFCYTGMRLEEVLGLKWEDIQDGIISVERAVVHPKRNQAEIKPPKTKASRRKIPAVTALLRILQPKGKTGFVLGGEAPLTYQQQKRCYNKARKYLGLEGYTAHDFRDTCATEWNENGMGVATVSKMLGHAKSDVTERCYVKFRERGMSEAQAVMEATA